MAPKSKCSTCGKFMAAADGATVTCKRCCKASHRACVGVPEGAAAAGWVCPECKARTPRDNREDTPVKGMTSSFALLPVDDCADVNTTALDTTTTTEVEPSLALEVRWLREEMQQTRKELRAFRDQVKELSDRLNSCDERIDRLESRVDELAAQKVIAESDPTTSAAVKLLEGTVASLQQELRDRDQDLLMNDLDISGVPEERGENTVHLVLAVATKLGASLSEGDIVSCSRVGGTRAESAGAAAQRPRTIAVRLARRSTRDLLLQAARVRRSVTSEGLHHKAEPHRVYINERLTKHNRQLFHCARESGRRLGWRFVWSKDGRVHARKEQGMAVHRVRDEGDLLRVFGADYVRPRSSVSGNQ